MQSHEDPFYSPRKQDYFFPENQTWTSATTFTAQTSTSAHPATAVNPKTIRLLSWNIDAFIPFADERMSAALNYLEGLIASTPADVPVVVFLQEMCPDDLEQIQESTWIRERFNLTEIDEGRWLSSYYGTTTLIDCRLKVKGVFRVPWYSDFDRDGLFVDIALSSPQRGKEETKIMRLCNTHLESLASDPPLRPRQLSAASQYLKETNVACALLAGDLNAIQPFDRTLHSENGLYDAYLELGGQEDDEDGYTWGYQVQETMRKKFGCSRMDKILFRGDLQPKNFQRIGEGVKVAEEHKEKVQKAKELEWVTDHYGVMGDFEITGDWTLQVWSKSEENVKDSLL